MNYKGEDTPLSQMNPCIKNCVLLNEDYPYIAGINALETGVDNFLIILPVNDFFSQKARADE